MEFHENGRIPRNFHKMYEKTVGRAKKWKRMGRQGGWGKIKADNWFDV